MADSQKAESSAGGALLAPVGWPVVQGLVAGFGDKTASIDDAGVVRVRQVHGDRVVSANALARGAPTAIEADALVATEPGVIAAVATADCVPILLLHPSARWSAAVHAGWRGTLAGIATRAVEVARAAGLAPEALLAAIGPAIGPRCYQVDEDLGARSDAADLVVQREFGRAKPTLNLRASNARILTRAGLLPSRIQVCGPCTRCRSDRYHSYRAARDAAGRQLSWIGWASRSP